MGLAKNDGNIPRGKNEAERETIGLERTAVAFSKILRGEFTKGTYDPREKNGFQLPSDGDSLALFINKSKLAKG